MEYQHLMNVGDLLDIYLFVNKMVIFKNSFEGMLASLHLTTLAIIFIFTINCEAQKLEVSYLISQGISNINRSNLVAAKYKYKNSISTELSITYNLARLKLHTGIKLQNKGGILESRVYELLGQFPNHFSGDTLYRKDQHNILYLTIPLMITIDKKFLQVDNLSLNIGLFYSRLLRRNWVWDASINAGTIPIGGDIFDSFLKKSDFGYILQLRYDIKIRDKIGIPLNIELNNSITNASQNQDISFLNRLLSFGIGISCVIEN